MLVARKPVCDDSSLPELIDAHQANRGMGGFQADREIMVGTAVRKSCMWNESANLEDSCGQHQDNRSTQLAIMTGRQPGSLRALIQSTLDRHRAGHFPGEDPFGSKQTFKLIVPQWCLTKENGSTNILGRALCVPKSTLREPSGPQNEADPIPTPARDETKYKNLNPFCERPAADGVDRKVLRVLVIDFITSSCQRLRRNSGIVRYPLVTEESPLSVVGRRRKDFIFACPPPPDARSRALVFAGNKARKVAACVPEFCEGERSGCDAWGPLIGAIDLC